jgi:acyl-coenzyme A synthetase/AMP-(fatty) acid ligase
MPSPIAEAFAALHRAAPHAPVAWTSRGARDRADVWSLAHRLAGSLPGERERVAISTRDPLVLLAAVLAVWQRDGCAVLLDAADPQAPRRDLAAHFGAGAIVVDEPAPAVQAVAAGTRTEAGAFAAIKLTSGSTDLPRGIGVSAAAMVADADQLEATMGIGARDRVFAAVPMSFSYGVGNLLVPALWRGRELVLPDPQHAFGFVQAMRGGGPTVLPAVPSLLRALVRNAGELPPSLRLVISAGAVLPAAVAAAVRSRFGLAVHAFYGATEAGGICYDRAGQAAEQGTVGTPVDGVGVTLDADGRVTVRSAAVGEALGGEDNPRGGVFRAPDLASWRANELVLLGRAGDVFDVGGHKVHPLEIERVIAELAGVDDVVVVPWRDDEGRASSAALVAARGVDELAVRRHCAQRLHAAKVPRCVVVVVELPRTSRGKLPRAEVERLLAGAAGTREAGR